MASDPPPPPKPLPPPAHSLNVSALSLMSDTSQYGNCSGLSETLHSLGFSVGSESET